MRVRSLAMCCCGQMSIIFSEAGLADVQPPCVVQTFVNHNARLFKIFIVGPHRFIIQRPSIKNLFPGDQKTIFFNSNDVSKSYSSSHLNKMDACDVDHPVIEPDEKKMLRLVSGIQDKFGLELLGIDVIIENGTGRYGVIDINAFPGYDGVEEFFPSLLELIQRKITANDAAIPSSFPNRTTRDNSALHHHSDAAADVSASPPCSQVSPTSSGDLITPSPPSPTKWYYFSANICAPEYVKSLPSERPRPDSGGSLDRTVAVNGGFTEY